MYMILRAGETVTQAPEFLEIRLRDTQLKKKTKKLLLPRPHPENKVRLSTLQDFFFNSSRYSHVQAGLKVSYLNE